MNEWNKLRCLTVLTLAVAAMMVTGCANDQFEMMKKKGMIGCCYESKLPVNQLGGAKFPVTLKVDKLAKGETSVDGQGSGLLALFPLVSPFAHVVFNNSFVLDPKQGLKDNEVEGILTEELRKTGLFKAVATTEPADYLLKGKIDLKHRSRAHFAGIGAIIYGSSLLFNFITPSSYDEKSCNLHVDIVSADGKKTVLSKDYAVTKSFNIGIVYDPLERQYDAFGKIVFPEVVSKMAEDINSLPADAWK